METVQLLTYSGLYVNPLALDPADVRIEDIAHSLSQQTRFTGHCRFLYSVGQHSCLVCDLLEGTGLELDGLLHDASEYVLHDLHRDLKHKTDWGREYKVTEKAATKVISSVFKLWYPAPPQIKKADIVALATERRDLMHPNGKWTSLENIKASPAPIVYWSPERTKAEFLTRYQTYRRV